MTICHSLKHHLFIVYEGEKGTIIEEPCTTRTIEIVSMAEDLSYHVFFKNGHHPTTIKTRERRYIEISKIDLKKKREL